MELWYDRPAARWTDALPGGNGRLGVMDDGGIERQTLWLNEDTFWSGYPRTLDCEDKSPHFRKIRELIEARQYQAAQALFEKEMSFFPGESYEPLGQLVLTYRNVPDGDYLRRLDLDTATLYSRQGSLEREVLVSAPHQVTALHLTTREAGGLHVSLTLDGPLRHRTSASAGELSMLAQAPSLAEPNYSNTLAEPVQYHEEPSHQGIRAAVLVQVRHRGGTLMERDGHLILEGADEAMILIAAQTSFRSWRETRRTRSCWSGAAPASPPRRTGRPCGKPTSGITGSISTASPSPWGRMAVRTSPPDSACGSSIPSPRTWGCTPCCSSTGGT